MAIHVHHRAFIVLWMLIAEAAMIKMAVANAKVMNLEIASIVNMGYTLSMEVVSLVHLDLEN